MKVNDFEEAYELLKKYNGTNNQILYLQYRINKTQYSLSDFDVTYILNNFDYKTTEYNKVVGISSDFGEILKKKYDLDFLPKKIRIIKVIGEIGESLHCYAQYRNSVEPSLMYIKRRYILNPLEVKEKEEVIIDVDFDKYDKISNDGSKLKKAQKEGIIFLLKNKKCILADGMGC